MLTVLALSFHRVGFFGQEGPIWAFLGFICLCVVVAILFKIMKLALPALGITEPWATIIYWVAVLVCFLLFIDLAFGFGWGS